MGHVLYKLGEDQYVIWSTVVDAPASSVLSRKDMLGYMDRGERVTEAQLKTADEKGHTWVDRGPQSPTELVSFNRAGPNEECITLECILRLYTQPEPLDYKLQPSDIQVYDTYDTQDGLTYWIPWAPGDEPESLEGVDLRRRVLKEE